MTNTTPPPIDYEELARQLAAEARGIRASLVDGLQTDLVRYENAVWKAAVETGYNQGWRDGYASALKSMQEAAARTPTQPPPVEARPTTTGLPAFEEEDNDAPTAQDVVLRVIAIFPGLRGVEIVEAVAGQGYELKERTVRTALHRLKAAGKIKNVEERWWLPTANVVDGMSGGGRDAAP